MKKTFLALVAAICGPALAAPPAIPAPWNGVWQGKIGNLPVRACLEKREYGSVGSYFYLNRLKAIPLEQQGGSKLWIEGSGSASNSPRWMFDQAGKDQLTGTWSQGSRRLPFRLTRVEGALEEYESACGSRLYNAPRQHALRIQQHSAALDGVGYTRLVLDPGKGFDTVEVETFRLGGSGPAIRRINETLREPFVPSAEGDWFSCMFGSLALSGTDGDYHESLEPKMISSRWLVINHHVDGFCGGAHPFSANDARLFDLSDGSEVKVHDWFNDQAIKRTYYQGQKESLETLTKELRSLILHGRDLDQADCRETITETEYWDIRLTRTGFGFTPSLPHAIQACAEEFEVPFDKLTRFLSNQGKIGIAAIPH